MNIEEPDRQLIVGALDSLGTALADHGHVWTDGERAIYNSALEILGVPPEAD